MTLHDFVILIIIPIGNLRYNIRYKSEYIPKLKIHQQLDFLHNSILCIDSQGNQVKIQGVPKKVLVRNISSLQAKKSIRKGYKWFGVNI